MHACDVSVTYYLPCLSVCLSTCPKKEHCCCGLAQFAPTLLAWNDPLYLAIKLPPPQKKFPPFFWKLHSHGCSFSAQTFKIPVCFWPAEFLNTPQKNTLRQWMHFETISRDRNYTFAHTSKCNWVSTKKRPLKCLWKEIRVCTNVCITACYVYHEAIWYRSKIRHTNMFRFCLLYGLGY